jgi:hypothetical protein
MPQQSAKRTTAQRAALQNTKAPASNAILMRRVAISTALGIAVVGVIAGTLAYLLRSQPGTSAPTSCASSGQDSPLKSGPATWEGQLANDWTIGQPQQVTITPASGPFNGTLQVSAEPVSLSLGSQALNTPPAIALHFVGQIARGPAYPVTLTLPVAGCWKLTAQLQGKTSSIFIRADAPQGASPCPATVPASGAPPGEAFIYGIDPVYWDINPPLKANVPTSIAVRVTNGYQSPTLSLTAAALADHGQSLTFSADQAQIASNDPGHFYQTTTPLTLPSAGCWLFVAHAGTSDGFIVVPVQ